jgi:hypothetical protein
VFRFGSPFFGPLNFVSDLGFPFFLHFKKGRELPPGLGSSSLAPQARSERAMKFVRTATERRFYQPDTAARRPCL